MRFDNNIANFDRNKESIPFRGPEADYYKMIEATLNEVEKGNYTTDATKLLFSRKQECFIGDSSDIYPEDIDFSNIDEGYVTIKLNPYESKWDKAIKENIDYYYEDNTPNEIEVLNKTLKIYKDNIVLEAESKISYCYEYPNSYECEWSDYLHESYFINVLEPNGEDILSEEEENELRLLIKKVYIKKNYFS